ncbi:hypothetical protein [Flavobacterium sp.]|uniref:hypothetical protein n=1 Tax=Flavobacterium sp. TaxID=239 RepID=UPI0035B202AD
MKSKVLLLAINILLFCSTATVKAQDNTIKFENVVNEQFGTLLESLLTDGKIDEANAKTYLETVFGYDEAVSSYLQTVNLSKQLSNINQGNLSFDNYMETLGSSLFNLIPESYKQELKNNPSYLGWQLGQELGNKQLSTETLTNFLNFISESIRKANEEKIRNQKTIEKLEKITPTIRNMQHKSDHKKLLLEHNMNTDDWLNFPYAQSEINQGSYVVSNNGKIVNNEYEISNQLKDVTGHVEWQLIKAYKNKNKFDFSQDFILEIQGKFINIPSTLTLCIGKGYYLNIMKRPSDNAITTPLDYELTPIYGNLKPIISSSKKKIHTKENKFLLYEQNGTKALMLPKEEIRLGETFKLTIEKKGTLFIAKINNVQINLQNSINYFPDKYFIGFYLADYSEKSKAKFIIEDLVIKHL